MCRSAKLKSVFFGGGGIFLLSVESMETGQLSIILYSVCKIQNLFRNTESLSVDVGFFIFFCTTYSVLSVRITSVF